MMGNDVSSSAASSNALPPGMGKCCVCLEIETVIDPCHKSHNSICKNCLRNYLTHQITTACPGVCPQLKCPLCVGSQDKKMKAPHSLESSLVLKYCESSVVSKYNRLVESTLSFQCGGCHQRRSLLVEYSGRNVQKIIHSMISMNAKLNGDDILSYLNSFSTGVVSVEECYQTILSVYTPSLLHKSEVMAAWDIFKPILHCIKDAEKRANMHLRYLRDRPFIMTECCRKKHCFRCKSKDWHTKKSCVENCSAADVDILPCLHCGLSLTRGDGCDSVTCLCSFTFNWSSELTAHHHALQFEEDFPEDTHSACAGILCETLSGDIRHARAWRRRHMADMNIALINWVCEKFGSLAAQWCATFDPDDLSLNQPHILGEVQALYRIAFDKAVYRCTAQNKIASEAIFTSMFQSDQDRAHVASQLLLCGGVHKRVAQLSHSCIPKLIERAAQWRYQHENDVEFARTQHQLLMREQFLCIYGHQTPSFGLLCSVSAATVVNRWDRQLSNHKLIFKEEDTMVMRQGNTSCYPAAIARLTSNHCLIRIRLTSCELRGNAMSFGLATKHFRTEGNSGVGGTPLTWGLMDSRDAVSHVRTVSYIYSSGGHKLHPWRKLQKGDLITVEVNIDEGYCQICLNEGEMSHTFEVPPARDKYLFAVTLANDHQVRIESDEWVCSKSAGEVSTMNAEHLALFSSFIRTHRATAAQYLSCAQDVSGTVLTETKINDGAAAWVNHCGGQAAAARTYAIIKPMLHSITQEGGLQADNCDSIWNPLGTTWTLIDQALCWGYQSDHTGK